MSRERPLSVADASEHAVDVEQRTVGLREMLALMAPETGSPALGGKVRWREPSPRRQLLLPSPESATNFRGDGGGGRALASAV
jgi:hypothetical protein